MLSKADSQMNNHHIYSTHTHAHTQEIQSKNIIQCTANFAIQSFNSNTNLSHTK